MSHHAVTVKVNQVTFRVVVNNASDWVDETQTYVLKSREKEPPAKDVIAVPWTAGLMREDVAVMLRGISAPYMAWNGRIYDIRDKDQTIDTGYVLERLE